MESVKCPHCHNTVPWGARVCRGCQAELDYGAPGILILLALAAAIFAGTLVGHGLHTPLLGVIVGIGVLYGLYRLLSRAFRHRVIFRRRYRTR